MSYIDIPVVSDADVLTQQALTAIAEAIPGWIPREGNLEVLLIEQFAAMAAEAATVASDVPASIFEYFGSLVGITPNPGTQAEIETTWSLVSSAPSGGYAIPAGTIAGFFFGGAAYQFQTETDQIIPSGATSLSITMQAVSPGAVYNIQNLSNFNPLSTYLQLQTSDPNISSILITETAANNVALGLGTDPESTDSFLSRLTAELQLLAPRPITPSDYALFAQNVAGVFRAFAFDGFNPFTNRFGIYDANPTTMSTTAGAPSGWGVFANGTSSPPTISAPGTSPNNAIQFVASSASLQGAVNFSAATSAGATSAQIAAGSGTKISTTVSPTNPTFVLIQDSANGDEIAQVVGVTGTTTQTLTFGSYISSFSATLSSSSAVMTVSSASALSGLAVGHFLIGTGIPSGAYITAISQSSLTITISANATSSGSQSLVAYAAQGLLYPHSTSATSTQLQGVSAPAITGLASNSAWYQSATTLQAAAFSGATAETNATASPYLISVATYVDGSVRVLSSLSQYDSSLTTYTASPKTIVCDIPGNNSSSLNSLVYDANADSTYTSLDPYIVSVQNFIAFSGATASKAHKIYYNFLGQSPLDISSADNPTVTTSSYNFIPDATFSDYNYVNGSGSSWGSGSMPWAMPSGVTALPNYGVQFNGTGSALGSAVTVSSQIFNLSHLVSDNSSATTRTYTLFGNIDASYTGSTYGDVSLSVVDANSGSTIATVSPSATNATTLAVTFTLSSPKDAQVKITFGTGLNVPVGSSVIVANIGVLSGTFTALTLPEYEQDNYFWTPGGLYVPATFNYARTVTLAPVDYNGLAVTPAIADVLSDYLAARREVNFTVQSITPSYVPIDIAWTGYVSVGYTAVTVQAEVNSAIRNFLSPANWAGGGNTPPYWDGSANAIRIFDIAGVILSVPGVSSVISIQTRTSYPTWGSYGTSDISMTGIAPLPIANTINGTLYTNSANAYSGLG